MISVKTGDMLIYDSFGSKYRNYHILILNRVDDTELYNTIDSDGASHVRRIDCFASTCWKKIGSK